MGAVAAPDVWTVRPTRHTQVQAEVEYATLLLRPHCAFRGMGVLPLSGRDA